MGNAVEKERKGTIGERFVSPLILHVGALFLVIGSLLLLPCKALAVCACGDGDGQPTLYEPITIDGSVADWNTTIADEDNNVCDGPAGGLTDLDAPVPSIGRDIVQFSYTYDNTWLYLYTERLGGDSSANTQTFLFYADTNDDGYMSSTETVIVAEWKGNNRLVSIYLAQYNPVDAVNGDSTVDSAGFGDGYALPGNLKNISSAISTYSGHYGTADGFAMEFAINWFALDPSFTGPVGHTIHVSSTNANKNAGGLGAQINDNLGGCGGGGGSTQFADLDFSPAYTLSGYWGDTVWGLHHLVNLGNGDDAFAFAYTILPTTWSPAVTLYLDDGDSIYDTGDSLIAGTVALASGSSVDIFTVYTIPSFSSGIATVVTTATSQYNTAVADSVSDTVNAPYPNISSMKYISAVADSTAATPGGADKALPGSVVTYTITTTNSGNAPPNSDSLAIRDSIPAVVTMYVGTGAASPVTFDAGTTLLSYSYVSFASTGDDIAFTSGSSASPAYTYTPVPDAQGYDSAVTGFRIEPQGDFDGSTSFDLTYQVMIP
ncbi:MAG: hypothetical protein RRA32_04695 [bacterium]|nr:hypothetical protein [bacterium]